MEEYQIDHDIHVFGITASKFPEGVEAAFKKLRELLPSTEGRTFYGVSRPDRSGAIVYKALVNSFYPQEGEMYDCESFVIKHGSYLSKKITDFMSNPILVGHTFQTILKDPCIDPNGYCLEIYVDDKDVICMVPITVNPNAR